jgi:hypothetical protein
VASVQVAIPNVPALVGLSTWCQALQVPFPLPPERLTNVLPDVVE